MQLRKGLTNNSLQRTALRAAADAWPLGCHRIHASTEPR